MKTGQVLLPLHYWAVLNLLGLSAKRSYALESTQYLNRKWMDQNKQMCRRKTYTPWTCRYQGNVKMRLQPHTLSVFCFFLCVFPSPPLTLLISGWEKSTVLKQQWIPEVQPQHGSTSFRSLLGTVLLTCFWFPSPGSDKPPSLMPIQTEPESQASRSSSSSTCYNAVLISYIHKYCHLGAALVKPGQ